MSVPARQRAADRWWLPYAVTAAAAAAGLAVLTWQVAVSGPLVAADWPVHRFLDGRQPDGLLRGLLDGTAKLGQRWLTLPILLATAAWVSWRQQRVRPMLAVVVALGTLYVVGNVVKFGLGRTPPARGIDMLHADGQAFPSGHAANATLTWALIALLLYGVVGLRPDRRLLLRGLVLGACAPLLVGVLMVVLDYHWLSDIPGGWLLGVVVLMLARLVLGQHERGGDGGETLAATGQAELVGGGAADGDRSPDRGGQDLLGLGPAFPDPGSVADDLDGDVADVVRGRPHLPGDLGEKRHTGGAGQRRSVGAEGRAQVAEARGRE
jgi:membrane-associated phospholipid phosphatase